MTGFGGGGYQADDKSPTHYVRIYNVAGVVVRQFGPMDEARAGKMKAGLEQNEDHTTHRVEVEEVDDAGAVETVGRIDHDRGRGGSEDPGRGGAPGEAGYSGAGSNRDSSEGGL